MEYFDIYHIFKLLALAASVAIIWDQGIEWIGNRSISMPKMTESVFIKDVDFLFRFIKLHIILIFCLFGYVVFLTW